MSINKRFTWQRSSAKFSSSHFSASHFFYIKIMSLSTISSRRETVINSQTLIRHALMIQLGISLDNLSSADRRILEKQALRRLQRASREENASIVEFDEEQMLQEKIIRYLHSWARFIIADVAEEFIVSESSMKSIKSTINLSLIKIFAELIKDVAINKLWREINRTYKVVARKLCYLLVLNRRRSREIDFASLKEIEVNQLNFHFTDAYESRISIDFIWFTHELLKAEARQTRAWDAAIDHTIWKIQAHTQYQTDCETYVRARIDWEWRLVQDAYEKNEVKWSDNHFLKDIMITIDFYLLNLLTNFRALVEAESLLNENDQDEEVDHVKNSQNIQDVIEDVKNSKDNQENDAIEEKEFDEFFDNNSDEVDVEWSNENVRLFSGRHLLRTQIWNHQEASFSTFLQCRHIDSVVLGWTIHRF
jgi:hypothetical protein